MYNTQSTECLAPMWQLRRRKNRARLVDRLKQKLSTTECLLQAATVALLSEQAFRQQLATGHGPSGPEGTFDSAAGKREVDRGLLGGVTPQAVA